MMKARCIAAISACLVVVPLQAVLAEAQAPSTSPVQVEIIDRQGARIGTATFEQLPGGVLISIDAAGLPPGERAFHVHEKGFCDEATGFASAGAHFNPGAAAHGLKDAHGPHAGDMPNLFVAADGGLRAEVFNPNVQLSEGANSLADADGSALIIHAGADDHLTQPTGNAGERIACAVIMPPDPVSP